MTRQIKFRAWDKNRNKMLHFTQPPTVIDEYNVLTWEVDEQEEKEYYGCLDLRESNMELMQYTGLKDKNGKEIYEGDIVKFTTGFDSTKNPSEQFRIGEIKYFEPYAMFSLHGIGFDQLNLFPKEIIGNIYENTELLTK